METSEEDNNPSGRATPRPPAQLQKVEPRVARRRLSQARHRATLAALFSSLSKTVYSQSDLTASKVRGPEGREEKVPRVEGLWSRDGDWPGAPAPEGCGLGRSAVSCGPLMALCLLLHVGKA